MADASPTSNANHRVTLAEIKRDIAHLIDEVREGREETKAWRQATNDRIRLLEQSCAANATNIARLDERQKATTGILAGLTTLGSVIAGAFGAWFK